MRSVGSGDLAPVRVCNQLKAIARVGRRASEWRAVRWRFRNWKV